MQVLLAAHLVGGIAQGQKDGCASGRRESFLHTGVEWEEEAMTREETARQRRAVWDRINIEAPDLADLLSALQARFGRPAEVRIELKGERIWPVK